jgi:ACR3 family arsenite transporter
MNDNKIERKLNVFEKYLSLWVVLCIAAGIIIGKIAPKLAKFLDGMAIYVNESPVVSIPIAICLFFMMYPIMVKIDFSNVIKSGKTPKPICQLDSKAFYHVFNCYFFPGCSF